MLIYVPLEPYKERYTVQLSAPKIGWLERRWNEAGVEYVRVEGKSLTNEITSGSVLDACGRGYWACSQVMELLGLLQEGKIREGDIIYFDDFWHPGISALPYSFHLLGIDIPMFAMLHAQSVDVYDFTFPMRHWMRSFEVGIGKVLAGIFVTSTCLKSLCLNAGIGTTHSVHVCGLPYNSDEVKTHFPTVLPVKKNQVIYTSRWDKEKCPDFFLAVVDEVLSKRRDVVFLITTSAREMKSNDPSLLTLLREYLNKYPHNLLLKEGLSKEEYYYSLLESKVQINTANQDFVSWTLLEATTCGCVPVYPDFRSFPEVFKYNKEYLYTKGDVAAASDLIIRYLNLNAAALPDVSWVYRPFDRSWLRMLQVMRGETYEPLYS